MSSHWLEGDPGPENTKEGAQAVAGQEGHG
jgi:hypothetical protein